MRQGDYIQAIKCMDDLLQHTALSTKNRGYALHIRAMSAYHGEDYVSVVRDTTALIAINADTNDTFEIARALVIRINALTKLGNHPPHH